MRRALAQVAAFLGVLLRWAPVWVPLVLLWQVGVRGFKPALAEQARLAAEEEIVRGRHARTRADFEALDDQSRAWQDPVYRERLRRRIEAERGR